MLLSAPRRARRGRPSAVFPAVLALILGVVAQARADQPPPANVVSQFETYWGARLDRDCGFSRQISATESLWLFCDTAVYDWKHVWTGFFAGTTAARGRFTVGSVPTMLTELPMPPGSIANLPAENGPAQFLPNPSGLTTPSGGACSYQAAWATGMANVPRTSRLLITYNEVCVVGSGVDGVPYVRGLGIVEVDASTNRVVAGPTSLYRAPRGAEVPAQWQLGSPIIQGDVLYLFASVCTQTSVFGTCEQGSIYVANTLAAGAYWHDRRTYHWWNGTAYPGWTTDPRAAKTVIDGAKPLAITADAYAGKGLALIVQNDVGSGYTVWRSESGSPLGPWRALERVPAITGCEQATGLNLCRALTGHPELSSTSQLMMSFYTPGAFPDAPKGHVRMIAIPW